MTLLLTIYTDALPGSAAPVRRTRSKVWRIHGIYAISSKFGKFPENIRVVVAREAYREAWLQGPSAVVALPAACLVNAGPYKGITLYSPYF
jgi:hypothetical protein